MILMMTGIGTSHLVTAPTAGGRFAYALLWCIPIAYISKYYGFETAFRFTHATGKSLIEAYATAWGKWPLWYVLITTVIQSAIGQAGRLIAASAVLYYFFAVTFGIELPLAVYGLVLGIIAVAVILRGSYRALESLTKILAGILFVSTMVVYFVKPAPLETFGHFFSITAPEGSWLIIAAFLGLLPTGIDVSLQASEWGKAKRVGMGRIRSRLEAAGYAGTFDPFNPRREDLSVRTHELPAHVREYCARWYKIALWDFRLGHVVSFFLACVFLLLAAVWLYPNPVQGRAVMGEIAGIFTESVGPWMMTVFLAGAFAATFSTAFNYFDGWPRIVGACCRNLFRPTAELEGNRGDRPWTGPSPQMVFRIQHLPRGDDLFACLRGGNHRRCAAPGLPRPDCFRPGVLHRPGNLFPESVLLPNRYPQTRPPVLPFPPGRLVQLGQPDRLLSPNRGSHLGSRFRYPAVWLGL